MFTIRDICLVYIGINMSQIKVLDLFCGAGGFSCGFENSDFNIMYGVDKNNKALKTYSSNHNSESFEYDIRDSVPEKLDNDYDLIIGSPPCKGFSDARGSRYIDDNRNGLVFEYISWVSSLNPDVAIMENVSGMRTISNDFVEGVQKEFEDIGYSSFELKEVNSAEYGVPQSRKRVFIVVSKDDNNIDPETILDLSGEEETNTVDEVFNDLPHINQNSKPDYGDVDMTTDYSKFVRNLGDEEITNHTAKEPNKDISIKIIERLRPGEMYRSNRFGDRYRQVWDVLEDKFEIIENDCFEFIANKRSKKDYRIKGKSVGHVDINKIKNELDYDKNEIQDTLSDLKDEGWLRKEEINGKTGYDINTKSGVRPKYMRIQPDSQSNTILTTDFKPRDKVHPYENRGLSLREGARLQSFPDDFEFKGSFNTIASQIGNAVPPLLSYKISKNVKDMLK